MTEAERKKLEEDYFYLHITLDFYARNREVVQMTDKRYWEHIDGILDEINRIKKQLKEDDERKSK